MTSFTKAAIAALALTLALTSCDAFTSPAQRIAHARAEVDSGQWGRAAIELRKVVQADDHNAQAWLLLAELSLDVADGAGAQSALTHAMTAGAKGPPLDALRARAFIARGQPQALIDALMHNEIRLPEPDRALALAQAYDDLQHPERALAVLAPVLQAHPELTDARLAEADALARQGKSDQALQALSSALAGAPHSSAALMLRAQILQRRGDAVAAEASFAQALAQMAPSTPLADRATALAGLTEARLAQGKTAPAAQSEAALVKLAPDAPISQLLGARVQLAHGDALGGVTLLERLVARAPSYLQARVLLGATQLQQGDLQQAQEQLEQAVQQAPDDVQARELLASVRLKLHQPEEALSALTPALSEQAADPQMLALLGAAEQSVGNASSVLAALEAAVHAHPQDRTLRLNLAQAYLAAGRAQQALPLLEQTPESTTPDYPGDLRRDGLLVQALLGVHGPAAAGAQVQQLLGAHPHDRSMLDFAAAYYASRGELVHARELLHQALDMDAHDVASLIDLAQVEVAAGDVPAAERALRSALAADPGNLRVRIALADVLTRTKAYDAAQALLAAANGPQAGADPDLQFALARVALARGDIKQANAALDRAIALQPTRAELVNQAGSLLLAANQPDAALARFVKATQLAPDNALYWFNAGRAQLALNRPVPARASLEHSIQLQPQWLPAISALVLIDLRAKDYQSAEGRVSQLLSSHPNDPGALELKGDVDWASGQRAPALAAWAEAQQHRPSATVAVKLFRARLAAGQPSPEQPLLQWLALQPNDRVIRNVLGDYYLARHALRPAAGQFQAILAQAPTDVIALNNLAWTYAQLKDPRAEATAQSAYQLAPMVSDVNDTLGWILAQQGQTRQALPYLARATRLDANNPELQYHYAYALAKQGQRAEAHQILSKLLATPRRFDSRSDAERLLADTKT